MPVGKFASDEKVTRRIGNYKSLATEGSLEVAVEDDSEDAETILNKAIEYLASPRRLRSNNFHDVLEQTRSSISRDRYEFVSRAKIEGT